MAYLVFADITHYLVTRWSLALHTQFHSEPSLELVGLLEATAFQTLLSLLQMLYICSEFSGLLSHLLLLGMIPHPHGYPKDLHFPKQIYDLKCHPHFSE